jgi:hypothetical protein
MRIQTTKVSVLQSRLPFRACLDKLGMQQLCGSVQMIWNTCSIGLLSDAFADGGDSELVENLRHLWHRDIQTHSFLGCYPERILVNIGPSVTNAKRKTSQRGA